MGAVTPIGIGVENYWRGLIEGKSGICPITLFDTEKMPVKVAGEIHDFKAEEFMPKRTAKDSARFAKFAFAAAKEALEQSGIEDKSGIGIIMGTALAGVTETAEGQNELNQSSDWKVNPRLVPKILGNIAAANIAIEYGMQGPCMTVSTACSSGGDALNLASMMIKSGEADVMLAVGADSMICPLTIASLAVAKALSREENPNLACRPFDVNRSGFVTGEGGGAMILESEEHALARGAKILGEIVSAANTNDAYHVTSPALDGHGAIACMKAAIAKAGIKPSQIGYVNAHGTATHVGDIVEVGAIKVVFGDASPAISSTKGATGHLMGAGGITEAIACVLACRDGIIPPTLNLTEKDPDCKDADIVACEPRKAQIRYAMSNAFGFGGQNSSIIVTSR